MNARVITLHTSAPLSQLLCAGTRIGRMHTPSAIAVVVDAERGSAPDLDLALAAFRRWAALAGDRELMRLVDELDDVFNEGGC